MKLLGLERNARICLGFFPLWAVPYTIYTYYLSLFLIEEGLSSTGIASLMTVANVSALVNRRFTTDISFFYDRIMKCIYYFGYTVYGGFSVTQGTPSLTRRPLFKNSPLDCF